MGRLAATIRQKHPVVRRVFDLSFSTRFLFDPSAWSINLRSIDATPFIPFYLRRRRSFLLTLHVAFFRLNFVLTEKKGVSMDHPFSTPLNPS